MLTRGVVLVLVVFACTADSLPPTARTVLVLDREAMARAVKMLRNTLTNVENLYAHSFNEPVGDTSYEDTSKFKKNLANLVIIQALEDMGYYQTITGNDGIEKLMGLALALNREIRIY